MQKQRYRQYRFVVVLALVLTMGFAGSAAADKSSSANYQVNETQFGIGGSQKDCSTNYCAKTSAGDTVVGNGSSANYSAQFGFNTSADPMLEMIVIGGNQNLGVLDDTVTGQAVSTIKIRNYLSNGYVLQIAGPGLSQGTHTLTNLSVPTTSQKGVEQFGINLVANTTPVIGANPVQVPSGTFSFGTVASGYAIGNNYKYINSDVIAQSSKSTGETDYTMSMIVNVSKATPGGQYTGVFSAVVVATF